MKKVLFTIQMIALIAMFPVYLVTELNHRTGNVTVNNPASEITKMPEESNMDPVSVLKDKGLMVLMPAISVTN
jgi:hypothetical protein